MTYSKEKFKELVLHIARKCADDSRFGAVKLNKVLWFSDFYAYANWGRSITGATYQKLPNGPAPRQLLPAQAELRQEGAIEVVEVPRYTYKLKRTLARRAPDLSLFTPDEIALVDEIIEIFRDHDASQLSALSHSVSVGWQLAEVGEDIPYSSIFLSPDPLSDKAIARGQELAREHGWETAAA